MFIFGVQACVTRNIHVVYRTSKSCKLSDKTGRTERQLSFKIMSLLPLYADMKI